MYFGILHSNRNCLREKVLNVLDKVGALSGELSEIKRCCNIFYYFSPS